MAFVKLLTFFFLQLILVLLALDLASAQGLKVGFYQKRCPSAEAIVNQTTTQFISRAPSLAAPLLRMHFHDCFVRGCDGSVLLNSTKNNQAEKDAIPNQSLRGFQVIDAAKSAVEAKCPGVVSCADILALVARDAVSLIKGPFWPVPTGRRDGRRSTLSDALNNLPSPFSNITQLKASFSSKGLSVKDLVVLSGNLKFASKSYLLVQSFLLLYILVYRVIVIQERNIDAIIFVGGHTIGISHCSSFTNRLYNFTGKGDTDPTLDPNYIVQLKKKCKPGDATTFVEMDPGSSKIFDTDYYSLVGRRRGLFQSDSALLADSATKTYVQQQATPSGATFLTDFAASMVKMGQIGVLTGNSGEIRKRCAFTNYFVPPLFDQLTTWLVPLSLEIPQSDGDRTFPKGLWLGISCTFYHQSQHVLSKSISKTRPFNALTDSQVEELDDVGMVGEEVEELVDGVSDEPLVDGLAGKGGGGEAAFALIFLELVQPCSKPKKMAVLVHFGIIVVGVLGLLQPTTADLKLNFYAKSCPKAEKTVLDYVSKHIPNAPSLAAALLRMNFHDCFVRVSISTSLRFSSHISYGGGPFWRVPTGRRDGLISNASEALANIPAPTSNFSTLQTDFANKGLDLKDLVLLSGAHTIGVSHCSSFSNRLYNFTGVGDQDPALDSEYATNLKARKCRSLSDNTTIVEMDPGSVRTFDLSYYTLLLKRRGLFQSDAALTTTSTTKTYITQLVQGSLKNFYAEFALSMEKMGRVGVKTGSSGEIRKHCAVVNS
ncbi:hypothetical protein RJ639_013598 [Escallonia herrerae]|uniref:peroxidase n=1 Tax=Escallonia herrerae TaxID=1293975 RepID=A0AA89AQ56_9ASTE|nr:hypothetical protein RJ639_013598 [Escallonia herrerae]